MIDPTDSTDVQAVLVYLLRDPDEERLMISLYHTDADDIAKLKLLQSQQVHLCHPGFTLEAVKKRKRSASKG